MFFKYFSLVVIAVVLTAVIVLFVFLGSLPARIARSRNHPQVDSINAMSWLGIFLTGGVGWAIALVWALYRYEKAEG